MTISSTRYFDGTKHTLTYLADEHFTSSDKQIILDALELVKEAEQDIFDVATCPICDKMLKAIEDEDIDEKLSQHKRAIHKQ